MTRSIVEVLKGELTDSEKQLFSGATEVDPAAYRAYLKGVALEDTWGDFAIWKEALGYFREAARIEPGFAPAYVGQARIYNYLGWFQPELGYPAMCQAAARKALDLDPDLPGANAEMGLYLFLFENRFAEAEPLLQRAEEMAPANVQVLSALNTFLMLSGQCEEAVRFRRREAQVDPLNFAPSRNLANGLLNCGHFEECIALCQALQQRFKGETTHLDYFLALAYLGLGQIDRALEYGKRSPGSHLAPIYWRDGQKEEAWQLVEEGEGSPTNTLNRLALLVLEEDMDEAMDILEEWAARRPVLVKFTINYPLYDPLHEHPRYQDLMRSMNIPGY